MIGILSRLATLKLLLDAAKVAVDGWAVWDEQRRKRREASQEQRIKKLEERMAVLETERKKHAEDR